MLRFGIMGLQLEALIPPVTNLNDIMPHMAQLEHSQVISQIASHGFDLIELGGDLTLFFPQMYSPPAIDRLAALKEELNLTYTVHLPLWSVEPSTPLAPVRDGSVDALIDCIKATLPLQPEVYVLHATGPLAAEFYQMQLPDLVHALMLQLFQGNARNSVRRIIQETGIPSRQLAIETIEFPFDMTLALADELDLSICLDTGHVLIGFCGPIDFWQTLARCLPRLAEVHLHDSPRFRPNQPLSYGQDHQTLGHGELDVGRLLDVLSANAWDGPVILELSISEAEESLEHIRRIRPGLLPPRS